MSECNCQIRGDALIKLLMINRSTLAGITRELNMSSVAGTVVLERLRVDARLLSKTAGENCDYLGVSSKLTGREEEKILQRWCSFMFMFYLHQHLLLFIFPVLIPGLFE